MFPLSMAPLCIFKYKIRIKNVFFTYKDVFLAKKYVFYFFQDLKIFENFLKICKNVEKKCPTNKKCKFSKFFINIRKF